MVSSSDIVAASSRIRPHVRRTELFVSEPLSSRSGATIVVKAEHRQATGSFKLRGALNKVLGLPDGERARGITTASSGNHGIAVAAASALAGVGCTVYLPSGTSPAKVERISHHGASIVTIDSTDAYHAELAAREAAERGGTAYVSPYNDRLVVAGQGTIGLEILQDGPGLGVESFEAVVVAVGGGGLISGIGTWLADHAPEAVLVGVSPENDHAMVASVAAGTIIEPEARPTFSDGTAGGIERDSITFDLCRALVAEWMTVSEAEIARAVAAMIDDHHELVEGSAGVALAGAVRYANAHPGARIATVSCGGNISSATLRRILTEADSEQEVASGEAGRP